MRVLEIVPGEGNMVNAFLNVSDYVDLTIIGEDEHINHISENIAPN